MKSRKSTKPKPAAKKSTSRLVDLEGQLSAIGKAQAVIEFQLDGTVITANDNFLAAIGYSLDEVRGKHHSLFVEPAHRDSGEYRAFWTKLGRGEYITLCHRYLALIPERSIRCCLYRLLIGLIPVCPLIVKLVRTSY